MALSPLPTTFQGGVRNTAGNVVVNVTLIPFIRSRKVYFKAEGLLPLTKHYAYFDGVDVTTFCREETFVNVSTVDSQTSDNENNSITTHPDGATDLISDSTGAIEGSFFIPNTSSVRFRTGAREFKLLDMDATSNETAISAAFARYTAQGTLETIQVPTPNPRPPRRRNPPRFRDPIAQSFIIEKEEGAFITSIDLFFQAAPSAGEPVAVQIRRMENGLPLLDAMGGAEKYVDAATVYAKISATPDADDSSTYVNFAFDNPIYVNGFEEYAIVVITDSLEYTVWTAVTGEFLNGSTSQRVMKQPYIGSFFKSSNGSTWTPDQSRDLMFRINRAVFSTSTQGIGYFENPALAVRLLDSNPFLTTNSSTTVRVYHPNHGMNTGADVTIAGVGSTLNNIPASEFNTTHTIVDGDDMDSYTITVTTSANATGRAGGSDVTATEDYRYSILYPNINEMNLPETETAWSIKTTSGTSAAGAETAYSKDSSYTSIFPNQNNQFATIRTVASGINQTNNMSGNRSLALKVTFDTSSEYVSPVLDLSRLSASVIDNKIDRQAASTATGYNVPASYVAETDAVDGTSVAKHITKPVTLEEPAIGLKVLFAANRPANSYITLYYKVLGSGSDDSFDDTAWTTATIDEDVQTDDDPDTFREYTYTIEEDQFTSYMFKIVFTSSDGTAVPRLRDLRAIALST